MGFQFEKLKVLVVEDMEPMRRLVKSVLSTMGTGRIMLAGDGAEGFRTFCAENPDIVISDWYMEPEDGMTLVQNIRANPKSPQKMVPIIMMSGYNALPRVELARDSGVTEFLVKPFTANDLVRRIAHTISKPRDFIETQEFFGPDRRRRVIPGYTGDKKRKADRDEFVIDVG